MVVNFMILRLESSGPTVSPGFQSLRIAPESILISSISYHLDRIAELDHLLTTAHFLPYGPQLRTAASQGGLASGPTGHSWRTD